MRMQAAKHSNRAFFFFIWNQSCQVIFFYKFFNNILNGGFSPQNEDGRTDGCTGVGARDTCGSKNHNFTQIFGICCVFSSPSWILVCHKINKRWKLIFFHPHNLDHIIITFTPWVQVQSWASCTTSSPTSPPPPSTLISSWTWVTPHFYIYL